MTTATTGMQRPQRAPTRSHASTAHLQSSRGHPKLEAASSATARTPSYSLLPPGLQRSVEKNSAVPVGTAVGARTAVQALS